MLAKTIFVTGGSRGIGEATVRLLSKEYNVAFTYFTNEDKARAICDDLGKGVMAIQCDVRDEESVKNALEIAIKRFGKVDVVVNNAGESLEKLLIDTTPEEWRECFAVNVDGVYNVARAALPAMLSRGSGCIVNVSSVWGRVGASGEVAYSSAKAAVIGLTYALAKEVAPSKVRVAAVAPGATDTDMMKAYSKQEVEDLCRDQIPLGRLCTPLEVAKTIKFIVENEYITGTCIDVDGLLR